MWLAGPSYAASKAKGKVMKKPKRKQARLGFVASAAGTPADLDSTLEAARLVSMLERQEAPPPRPRQRRRKDAGPDL